jgi:hypothetical protein
VSVAGCTFIAAAVGSLLLTLGFGLHYWPDVRLYTSGVSLFPSPLGTLIGTALGMEGLAVVQALCCGAIAGGLVLLRPPFRAVIVATPVLVWCSILGVDVLAAVLFVAGYWLDRGWLRWASGLVHLSELLLVVAASRLRWALACVVVGSGLLLATPYRAGLVGSFAVLPQALAAGALVALVGLLPVLMTRSLERAHVLLACGVGVGVGFAVRHDLAVGWPWYWTTTHTLRYALPLVLVGLVASAGRLAQASSDAIAAEACRDSPEPRSFEAAGQGFEPQLPGPEPGVLPLDDPATAGAVYRVGYEAFPSPISSR